jgi:fused signal recognition particle receptor
LFNRFKEKLSGFKEALSSKLQEKAAQKESQAELEAQNAEAQAMPAPGEISKNQDIPDKESSSNQLTRAEVQAASNRSDASNGSSNSVSSNNFAKPKPKNRFSILDKAKSLVFEQEIIIDEKDLTDPLWALEMALLESDVALPVAEQIVSSVKSELVGHKKKIGVDTGQLAEDALRSALVKMLSANRLDFDEYIKTKEKPVKILFVGVNGTGKTTSIAKVARYLMDQGYSVVLAAGDTFRAGAIEQLEVHGERLGLKVIKHKTGGDPAAVIFDSVEYARAHNKDVVLADTAGRLHTNINLMDQMRKIVRVTKPDLLIFVDEAIAGNDAVERARLFNESVPIGGSILTKTDADAKGGSAISIAYITGKPVLFLGVGQNYPDLVKFEPQWLVDRLLGEAEA